MNTRKICMVGDFAVGKTSLVSRFVDSCFDERYLSTVGVKIDTKGIKLPSGDQIKLVIWDIAGKNAFAQVDTSYLRDAAGYLLVVDGTRADTLDSAVSLQHSMEKQLGAKPFCVLLNKQDLVDRWALDATHGATLSRLGWAVRNTSARNGDGVEEAFVALGAQLVHRG